MALAPTDKHATLSVARASAWRCRCDEAHRSAFFDLIYGRRAKVTEPRCACFWPYFWPFRIEAE